MWSPLKVSANEPFKSFLSQDWSAELYRYSIAQDPRRIYYLFRKQSRCDLGMGYFRIPIHPQSDGGFHYEPLSIHGFTLQI